MGSHWGGGWTDVNSHRHPATHARARGGAEQEKERGRCVRREGPSNWPVIPRRTSSSPAPERPRHLLPVVKRSDPLKPIKNGRTTWPRSTAHDCSVSKKTFFIISGPYSPAHVDRDSHQTSYQRYQAQEPTTVGTFFGLSEQTRAERLHPFGDLECARPNKARENERRQSSSSSSIDLPPTAQKRHSSWGGEEDEGGLESPAKEGWTNCAKFPPAEFNSAEEEVLHRASSHNGFCVRKMGARSEMCTSMRAKILKQCSSSESTLKFILLVL